MSCATHWRRSDSPSRSCVRRRQVAASSRGHGAIARQLAQLTRLVGDLLDISRVTLGKIQLQLDPVDLAKAIGDAVETMRPLVDANKHELHRGFSDLQVAYNLGSKVVGNWRAALRRRHRT